MPAAVAALGMAVAVWPRLGTPERRLRWLLTGQGASGNGAAGAHPVGWLGDSRGWRGWVSDDRLTAASRSRPWLIAGSAGAATALFWGGSAGLVAGAAVALVAGLVLFRREQPAERRLRERRLAALPFALDLLAVCLRSGLPTGRALALVCDAVQGPLAGDLSRVSQLYELGAGTAAAWAEHMTDPLLSPVARAATRAADSGSALASSFDAVAVQVRADNSQCAETAGRAAAVWVLAPLGLCFLPAFVCLGVVPTVLGVASAVLG